MAGNVGAARDFFAAHCDLPRWQVAHYVAVVESPAGDLAAVSTCCDGTRDAARMLRGALAAVAGQVALSPDSDGIIVSRADLKAVIAGAIPADTRKRFIEALGEGKTDGQ